MINRIILIGNGFDLAHEMNTTYKDFINDYWTNIIEDYKTSKDEKFKCEIFEIDCYKVRTGRAIDNYSQLIYYNMHTGSNLNFHNTFFQYITRTMEDVNWGGIESIYYDKLLLAMDDVSHELVQKLNEEFEVVKKLLNDYLSKIQNKHHSNEKIIAKISKHIFEPISFKNLSEDAKDFVIKELLEDSRKKITDVTIEKNQFYNNVERKYKLLDKNSVRAYLNEVDDDILKSEIFYTSFLNFNYTDTEKHYQYNHTQSIHIHGQLESINNPMIFGYGDELDEEYNKIEKLRSNKYLDNIKSINYSKTNNYKRLLETINSGLYQIFVMGHSCDVSDRTLLNTIFEHDNCAGIKIFYYENGESKNNYLDVYKNISRNFNDKRKLRDRVVNYSDSEALISAILLHEIENDKNNATK